ncbi:hypothetical protein, partial [Pseudomonas amygdali]|uniref:hypothetical protein n=1 Tax=Pseudomonas amygdali TaxID=47877 RepID=UPI001F2D8ED8
RAHAPRGHAGLDALRPLAKSVVNCIPTLEREERSGFWRTRLDHVLCIYVPQSPIKKPPTR